MCFCRYVMQQWQKSRGPGCHHGGTAVLQLRVHSVINSTLSTTSPAGVNKSLEQNKYISFLSVSNVFNCTEYANIRSRCPSFISCCILEKRTPFIIYQVASDVYLSIHRFISRYMCKIQLSRLERVNEWWAKRFECLRKAQYKFS